MRISMRTSKNRNLLLTAAILFFALSVANASALGRFTMGVKGGLNVANMRIESANTISSYQTRTQFVWGGFISYRLSDLFSLQVEVLDSPKGTRLLQALSGTNGEITLMYRYTEVPLLIKLAQGRGGRLMPSLYAGPYWAKLREAQIRSVSQSGDVTENLTGQRSTDFGLIFGFSLDYNLGPITLIGEARYGLGLLDVDKAAGSTLNHRGFSFMAGIGI